MPPTDYRLIGNLFRSFLKLGLTAFGGPAMVAYIRDLAVTKNQWLTKESFQQGVAICQIIPGATAMQAAAYVGLRTSGPLGALAAYLGFGLPAFFLMLGLAALYQHGHDQVAIIALFRGLQLIVIALVANAAITFGRGAITRRSDLILGLLLMLCLLGRANPVLVIGLAALLGLVLYRHRVFPTRSIPPVAASRPSLLTPILLSLALILMLAGLRLGYRQLYDLAMVMIKVDLLAFGGGYGSVPLMFDEVVRVRQWLDPQTFMDGIALGQVTPGPIVITATFVGYLLAALPGALVGTISIFAPSLILLTAVVSSSDRLQGSAHFQRAMQGVLVSFVGLLASVTIRFIATIHWGPVEVLLTCAALVALHRRVEVLWVVVIGGLLAMLLF